MVLASFPTLNCQHKVVLHRLSKQCIFFLNLECQNSSEHVLYCCVCRSCGYILQGISQVLPMLQSWEQETKIFAQNLGAGFAACALLYSPPTYNSGLPWIFLSLLPPLG